MPTSTPPKPSVAIVGASGRFGKVVIPEFIHQKENFSRIVIIADPARNPEKFDAYKAQGVEVVVGSWSDSRVYEGIDVVITLVGNTVMKDQPAMIDAAVAAGVTHFYPSEYGSDIALVQHLLTTQPSVTRYWRDKFLTREHLEKTAAQNKNFRYTCLITGAFLDMVLSHPFFGIDRARKVFEHYGGKGEKVSVTSTPDAARYLVTSILLPFPDGRAGGRTLRTVGGDYTWEQFLSALETFQGVEYEKKYMPREVALQRLEEAMKNGTDEEQLDWASKAMMGNQLTNTVGKPRDNADSAVWGFEPESLETVVKRV